MLVKANSDQVFFLRQIRRPPLLELAPLLGNSLNERRRRDTAADEERGLNLGEARPLVTPWRGDCRRRANLGQLLAKDGQVSPVVGGAQQCLVGNQRSVAKEQPTCRPAQPRGPVVFAGREIVK